MNYQTEFDYYITPDGVTVNLNDYNVEFLVASQSQGMPTAAYQTQQGPFQHGASPLTYLLQPRSITMIITRVATSRKDFWTQRANLLDYFRPNRQTTTGVLKCGQLRKIFPDGSVRDIDVLIQDGLSLNIDNSAPWAENRINDSVQFIAFDPTFYDPTQVTVTSQLVALSNLVFPITFPITFGGTIIHDTQNITYPGSWFAYPIIVVTGPLYVFTVENLSVGGKISLNYSVALGDTVTIDTRTGYKTANNAAGTNLLGYLTSDSDISTFHIAPNPEATLGVNQLRFSGSGVLPGTTKIQVQYYTRYIGI
jgi:Phage tail protein